MMASPLVQYSGTRKSNVAKHRRVSERWPFTLGALQLQDAMALLNRMSLQTCRCLGIESIKDLSQAKRFILGAGEQQQRFAIRHEADGLIGSVAFTRVACTRVNGMAELSYWLAEPYRGLGVMSWALNAVLTYLKSQDIKHVLANVYTFNQASQRLLARLGFKPCAEAVGDIVCYQLKQP
ncbi:GNAT family N-acetyltransferase [Pseudoalteromonas luteoviolacea]|uniref:GNAT family N-acetyltransferase n=1 Tax=Pseudoalteromonas luteoviolacea TaxID=43657 RepID=UPI001B36CF4B|nr:GNAT family N-acetyltransferase [Pseudoalteromonas luteoviolacea]MBQ4813117.1 GNAT family N-acetyltransferase [Pseudoalteromonas luteoviolacea]